MSTHNTPPLALAHVELSDTNPIIDPFEIGQLLRDNVTDLPLVVSGAFDESKPHEEIPTAQEFMDGLRMVGIVQSETVRFPKIHKMLGHLVIGKERYYTPINNDQYR